MIMPNFLTIGAAKAGTTSIYNYLNQHPEIYMSPNKEPNFFAYVRMATRLLRFGRLRSTYESVICN